MDPAHGRAVAWFLFTDLEDSSRLWEVDPAAMKSALASHDSLVMEAIDRWGGRVVKHTGDGVLAVFDLADAATGAAVDAQRHLVGHDWSGFGPLRARMGLHGGVAEGSDDGWFRQEADYVGPAVHRCARVMGAAHGRQIVCTRPVVDAVHDVPVPGLSFTDLGTHVLRGFSKPERVFAVTHPELPIDFPPLRTFQTVAGNLPAPSDDFVGRERDVDEIGALVRRHRLVTLTGVGGVGKTRLALRVGETLTDEFPDGVWLVRLSSVTSPELLPSAVAATLGVRERPGLTVAAVLLDAMRSKRVLIVLDNCEHVVDAAAELAASLIAVERGPYVLATSRESLDIPGEWQRRVTPLDLPEPGLDDSAVLASSAVRLLLERARAVRPDHSLHDQEIADVADLCRQLDGIPLALELAAGRLDAMSVGEVVDRLDRRFKLLRRQRSEAGRHRTLRAAIDWSHDLLTPDERVLFRRLAVFTGGIGVTSAEEVTAGDPLAEGDVADLLGRLVHKSVVVVDSGDRQSRFRLLESLRQYAGERLDEANEREDCRDAHMEHFIDLVEELERDLRSRGQAHAYEILQYELDNIRSALGRLIERRDGIRALRVVRILRTFWTELSPSEGVQYTLTALAIADDAPPAVRAGGLADASWIAYVAGREDAARLARSSIELSTVSQLSPEPEANFTLALVALFEGAFDDALEHFDAGTEVARATDDSYEMSSALTGSCLVRAMLGDSERAVAEGHEAVARARALGYDTQVAGSLASLGFAYGASDPSRAVALIEESLSIKSDTTYSAMARVVAGHLQVLLGDIPSAVGHLTESLRLYFDFADPYLVPTVLEGLASTRSLEGRPEEGAWLLGLADQARTKFQLSGLELELALRAVAEGLVTSMLSPEAYEASLTAGRNQLFDDGLEIVLRLTNGGTGDNQPPR